MRREGVVSQQLKTIKDYFLISPKRPKTIQKQAPPNLPL